MIIDTGEKDELAGFEKNEDGSITIESGQGGIDIEVEPTRAPLTAEEWEALLARADARNGNYTPTFYRDPATGSVIEVQVVYMGIGRSMIMVNGQEKLVNTVELHWETEAPEDKVLAVINAPKNGYAWIRMKPNTKITTAKIEQCRMDQVVRVISTNKNWTFIDHDGRRGYVKTASLEFFANDHTDFETGVLSVKGKTSGRDTCNIRSRDDKHRVLADYPLGTPVTVFDVIDDFAQIVRAVRGHGDGDGIVRRVHAFRDGQRAGRKVDQIAACHVVSFFIEHRQHAVPVLARADVKL